MFDEALFEVEHAFRTCKTGHLKVRPIFVRSGQSTRGHAFVVMLACLLVRELTRLWRGIELHEAPKPRDLSARLLEAAGVTMPGFIPKRTADVVTKKSLAKDRLNN
ncbi:MAG: hypothetical protein WCK89_03930 [bacterium]